MSQAGNNSVVSIRRGRSDASLLLANAEHARRAWSERKLAQRLAVVSAFRDRLAANGRHLAALIGRRPIADSLSGEILPLLEACRYLEANAASILGSSRPRHHVGTWLRGTRVRIDREPLGTVLIIAPSNYPLMLPGIQALQALVAGNAVVIKPAPGSRVLLEQFAHMLKESGLPDDLLTIVDESIDTADELIAGLVDKLVFTGSSSSGKSVLSRAADKLIPATVELSGWDACIVLASADLDRCARALAFALRFNAGQTCLAPRRILVQADQHDELIDRMAQLLRDGEQAQFPVATVPEALRQIQDAIAGGARLIAGELSDQHVTGPVLLTGVSDSMSLFNQEVFGPIAMITEVADADDAIAKANSAPYGLGASVFGDEMEIDRIVDELDVGVVMINDAVVPAAHPALPIAARKSSGFGSTRGAEGLLEFTQPKAVIRNRSRRPLHLGPRQDDDDLLLDAYINSAYRNGWLTRIGSALRMIGAVRNRSIKEKQS